ncbi:P-loop containing nucleoside triphosphate hydrolases superfamily protein, putative [Theobroma cacao]|uniref:Chromosome transmission fidelity protein 18 homolog n=1 Tax=Theobroma cacao TaxID=3641 RepID=A0A061ESR7_THECC|nr:P-loop containing nucleoside triphosphate hydrolases superfamily protein, putative [Theobroma cacao]
MEIDIPLPEELELLEANSHFYEEPYLDPPSPDPFPPKSPPSENLEIDGSKRPRNSVETESPPEENKRTKTIEIEEEEEEEKEKEELDWLRYSPPQENKVGAAVEKDEEVYLSRHVSAINGDCMPVTAPSGGERVYAKISRAQRDEILKKLNIKERSNGLIFEPVNVLLQRVEQQVLTKALQASSEHQSDITLHDTPMVHEQLWVDKYAPSSFTELLSDEQTNREVLLWLKQWDSCVFGSEIRSTSDEVLSALRRHSSTQHQKTFDSNFSRKSRGHRWSSGSYRPINNVDQGNNNQKGMQELWNKKSRLTGPPEQKILLLCGPPGLGKTTLAHVAAKHCGYHVVEVNASDDRSSSTIETKILDVVQMNSVMADSRPKCLVIDEIDGALGDGKGAVEVILKMVSAERKSDFGRENNANKKGRKTASLSRPVICICNDLYTPALRPLRQVAKVHIFVQPTVSRVVSRLKYICNKEGMRTSSIALTALADYTECDIRSCLNTLQFLNKKKEALNVMEISSQVVGRKDMSKSAFDIWKEIFQKRKMKRDRKSNSSSGSSYGEFDFLHSLISNRGDYDVILDGIHENILQLQYHDPVMQKTVKCLNSLGVSDLMQQYVMRTQQMPLQVYQPFIAITLHRMVAQVQKPIIEWPKSYQRYRTMLMEKTDILRSWHQKIPPYISRHLSTKSCIEDLISPLLHILSPPKLRPVALHLLSETEKNDLAQLVNVMVSYSITYKNVKSDSLSTNLGQEAIVDASALSFDPPIGEFIKYKDYTSDHHVLALAMKQVLLHEVEKQKILQVSIGKSVHTTDGCSNGDQNFIGKGVSGPKSAKPICENAVAGAKNFENVKNIPNTRQGFPSTSTVSSSLVSSRSASTGAKQKSTADTRKPPSGFNFFERFRKPSSKGSQDSEIADVKEVTLERDLRPLLFKFNEGFTNAVKRPVRMREFLLR